MTEQVLILDAEDLDRLVLECLNCHAFAVIPLEALGDRKTGEMNSDARGTSQRPSRLEDLRCAGCGERLVYATSLCKLFFDFLAEVTRAGATPRGTKARFQLRVPTDSARAG